MKPVFPTVRPISGLAFGVLGLALGAAACSSHSEGDKPAAQQGTGGNGGGGNGAGTADWHMLGHGPESTFHNKAETKINVGNVGTLRVKWEKDINGLVQGAVSVVDGVVYAMSSSQAYAWNAETGEQLWTTPEGNYIGITGSVAIDDGLMYFIGAAGTMYALDIQTGAEVWQKQYDTNPASAGWSSPIIVGNKVIIGISSGGEIFNQEPTHTFRGGVAALDKKTGDVLWIAYTASEAENGCAVWATPSADVENKLVFAPTGNNYSGAAGPGSDSLFAFDLDTGEKKWSHQFTEGDVFAVFATNGNPDFDLGANAVVFEATIDGTERKLVGVGQKSGDFHVRDRLTGEEVWSVKLGGGSASPPMGAFNSGAWDGERLVVLENNPSPRNGILFALDPATGDTIWSRETGAVGWGPVTIANGVGYNSRGHFMEAFDVTNGAKLFEIETPGDISSTPVVSDGSVYFGSGVAWLGAGSANKVYALTLP
jgi:polyvinyl alcohol dehydrogenase (cytochrome)